VDELRVRLRRKMMKKLALGLVAAGALFTATAVPAMAQIGVYAGPGGIGVGVGAPGPYYYGRPYYPYDGYYNYAPGWGYGLRDGGDATSTAITVKVCA
jgi:hypothetical protein